MNDEYIEVDVLTIAEGIRILLDLGEEYGLNSPFTALLQDGTEDFVSDISLLVLGEDEAEEGLEDLDD